MKYILFVFLYGFLFLLLGLPAFSTNSIGNIASVSGEIIAATSGISSSIIPTVKPIGSTDNFSSQTVPAVPTIKDNNAVISSVPPTIVPIDKNIKPPEGLLVHAPNNLEFPERGVSTSDQWVQINPDPGNPITISDKHEGKAQWSLTISATDFSDKDNFIPVSNLSLWVDMLNAQEGSTQNIHYTQSIQFKNSGEGYQLVSKDLSGDNGIYNLTFGLKLRIPANNVAGKYQTELVLTII